jgi:hypothetical protein
VDCRFHHPSFDRIKKDCCRSLKLQPVSRLSSEEVLIRLLWLLRRGSGRVSRGSGRMTISSRTPTAIRCGFSLQPTVGVYGKEVQERSACGGCLPRNPKRERAGDARGAVEPHQANSAWREGASLLSTTVMFSLGRDLVGFVSRPKHLSFFTASPELARAIKPEIAKNTYRQWRNDSFLAPKIRFGQAS